jgi:membrane protein required for colicin V production
MTILDYVLLIILLIFAVMGFVRGLISQLFSVVGIVLGFVLSKLYYVKVASLIQLDPGYGNVIAFVSVFLAVFLVVKILGLLVEKLFKIAKFSLFNRTCGLLLGLFKGFIVCVVITYLILGFYPGGEGTINRSPSARYFLKAGKVIYGLLPRDVRQRYNSSGS